MRRADRLFDIIQTQWPLNTAYAENQMGYRALVGGRGLKSAASPGCARHGRRAGTADYRCVGHAGKPAQEPPKSRPADETESTGMSTRTKIGVGAVALGCYMLGCFSSRPNPGNPQQAR
jgi:hypothetical protein